MSICKSSFNIIFFKFLKIFVNEKTAARIYMKKYLKLLKDIEFIDTSKDEPSDYKWTLWFQDEMPEIVRVCIDSIKKFYPDLIVLNEHNISDYIEIPNYIMEKHKCGIISHAHLSDYIRSCLLVKYGGVWFDSTLYMTQPIPKCIKNSDLFMFRYMNLSFPKNKIGKVMVSIFFKSVSSFFIVSKKNNYVMKVMKTFMETYWKDNNFLCHYFMWHYFIMLLVKYDKNVKNIFNNMYLVLSEVTFILQTVMYQEYDEKYFKMLKDSIFVHKLTYKNNEESDVNPNSYLKKLISMTQN